MPSHPFQSIPSRIAVPLFLIAMASNLYLMVRVSDRSLRAYPSSPLGIVSFEMAGTQERTERILEDWGADGQKRARDVQAWDYLFLVAYSLTLSLAAAGAGVVFGERRFIAELAPFFAWAALIAGGLDAIENRALDALLRGDGSLSLPMVARAAAGTKFVLLFAVAAFLIVAALPWTLAIVAAPLARLRRNSSQAT